MILKRLATYTPQQVKNNVCFAILVIHGSKIKEVYQQQTINDMRTLNDIMEDIYQSQLRRNELENKLAAEAVKLANLWQEKHELIGSMMLIKETEESVDG
jgi:hypothetical protein